MVEQMRLHLQRRLMNVLEEAVQEFQPQEDPEAIKDPLSFLFAKALESAADLQTLWPAYSKEGSVWEAGSYQRQLLLVETLASGVIRSLRRAQELAQAYGERGGESLPRTDELGSALTNAVEIHDRITRTLARLNKPRPALDRNMLAEARAAMDRGEGENIREIARRLESGGSLVKE